MYVMEEQYNEALDWYDQLLREFPSDPLVKNCHFARGEIYSSRNQWFEAGEAYYNVWRLFGVSAEAEEALFKSAQSYGSGGDIHRAVELYQQYLTRYPSGRWGGEAAAGAVTLLVERESVAAAQELLTSIQGHSFSDQWMLELDFLRAEIDGLLQNDDAASEVLVEILSTAAEFPSRGEALKLYAEILFKQENFSDAWGYYAEFAELHSEISLEDARFWAETAFRAQDYNASNELYTEMIREGSEENSAELYYQVARNYAAMDDFPEALQSLNRVITTVGSGELAESAQLKIAELYFQNGIYTNSIEEYRRYLELNGDQSDMVLYRIGRIYQLKLNAPEIALREYEKLLKWYTGSPYAARASEAMAELYESRGDYEDALSMYNYLASVEGQSAVGHDARSRAGFLLQYRIPNTNAALSELTALSVTDSLSETERRLHGAKIYRFYLNDPNRAIELLEDLNDPEEALFGEVLMMRAGSWKDMAVQAEYDQDSDVSQYASERARTGYQLITETEALMRFHDEAQYELVSLENSAEGYEEYTQQFQTSPFRGKAFLTLADIYSGDITDSASAHRAASAYRGAYESGDNDIVQDALTGAVSNYLRAGVNDSAEIFLNNYQASFPDESRTEEFVWLQGELAVNLKNFESAEESYQYIVEFFPQGIHSSEARLKLAQMQLVNGASSAAYNNFVLSSSLFADGKNRAEALNGMVEALIYDGRIDDALRELGEEIAEDMFSESQLSSREYLHGRALQLADESFEALGYYSRALSGAFFPQRETALREAALLNYSLREYGTAAEMYSALRGAGNDSVYIEMKYLASSILAGRMAQVEEEYRLFRRGVGESDPSVMAELYFAEGLYYYRSQEYDRAENRFEFIIEDVEGTDLKDDAAYYLALILYDQREMEDALEALQRFTVQYEESELLPTAHFMIGMIYNGAEMLAEAGTSFEKVTEISGDDIELRFRALVNGASVWQRLNAWESAAEMNEAVLLEFGDRVDASSFALKTGFSYFKANRVTRALEYFDMANQNPSPTDAPEIVYWIAQCNKRLGNVDLALEQFLQISVLFRGSGKWPVTADFEAARIYEQRGEFENALSLYREIVRVEGENSPIGGDANERVMILETLTEEQ
jgi:tetratricopeptide (TPR) repeat protein